MNSPVSDYLPGATGSNGVRLLSVGSTSVELFGAFTSLVNAWMYCN